MKLVLDTSVIVAATRSARGASRQLLRGALSGQFELLLSVPLALEYEMVLKRPQQLGASAGAIPDIEELLTALIAASVPVHRAFFLRPLLRDADDDLVLEAALSGNADLLVTLNRRDFELAGLGWKIRIASPAEALLEIRRRCEKE